jgi:hypothetical protein
MKESKLYGEEYSIKMISLEQSLQQQISNNEELKNLINTLQDANERLKETIYQKESQIRNLIQDNSLLKCKISTIESDYSNLKAIYLSNNQNFLI